MKIFDVITEAGLKDILKNKMPWNKKPKVVLPNSDEAIEAFIKQYPGFIEKQVAGYSDAVLKTQAKAIKPPDLEFWLKNNDKHWALRSPEQQATIKAAVERETKIKLNPPAKTDAGTPPAPTAPNNKPAPADKKKEKAQRQKEIDAATDEQVKKILINLEKKYPGLGEKAKRAASTKWKALGRTLLVLQAWGIADVTIEFLQDSARVDQAMADETNPMDPAEASILHQRIQSAYYIKLGTLALAPKVLSSMGWKSGMLGGAVIGYTLANYGPTSQDEQLRSTIGGAIIGGASIPIAKMIVDFLFRRVGAEAWKLIISGGTKAAAPALSMWMTSDDGREFINGLVRGFLEAPGGLPEDRTILGVGLNAIRTYTPDIVTDIRRATYKLFWDWFGKGSVWDKANDWLPDDIQKFLEPRDLPPVGRGDMSPDYKPAPGTVSGVGTTAPATASQPATPAATEPAPATQSGQQAPQTSAPAAPVPLSSPSDSSEADDAWNKLQSFKRNSRL